MIVKSNFYFAGGAASFGASEPASFWKRICHDILRRLIVSSQTAKLLPMQIGYLADHKDFISTLANWHHQEWSYLRPEESKEARIERLRGCCGHKEIPTVVIAFTDGELLGSAMLVAHDMDTRTDLSPWLAGVFVAAEQRRRSIGGALVQRIIEEARGLGVQRLYLYTPGAEEFYARRGWSLVERTNYHEADVTVMCLDLPSG
jgi:N-acetylglutamate synthase-like GNAT family acetyltransferase